jgi:hypothetical protein
LTTPLKAATPSVGPALSREPRPTGSPAAFPGNKLSNPKDGLYATLSSNHSVAFLGPTIDDGYEFNRDADHFLSEKW